MTEQYKKEVEVLRLLNRDWDNLSDSDQQAKHHELLWTIEALVEKGLLNWIEDD